MSLLDRLNRLLEATYHDTYDDFEPKGKYELSDDPATKLNEIHKRMDALRMIVRSSYDKLINELVETITNANSDTTRYAGLYNTRQMAQQTSRLLSTFQQTTNNLLLKPTKSDTKSRLKRVVARARLTKHQYLVLTRDYLNDIARDWAMTPTLTKSLRVIIDKIRRFLSSMYEQTSELLGDLPKEESSKKPMGIEDIIHVIMSDSKYKMYQIDNSPEEIEVYVNNNYVIQPAAHRHHAETIEMRKDIAAIGYLARTHPERENRQATLYGRFKPGSRDLFVIFKDNVMHMVVADSIAYGVEDFKKLRVPSMALLIFLKKCLQNANSQAREAITEIMELGRKSDLESLSR